MTTTYTKSLSTDFGGNLNSSQFHTEIDNEGGITPNLEGVNLDGDDVDITFDSALSGGEQTTLDTLISNHTPDPNNWGEFTFKTVTSTDSPYDARRTSLLCDTTGGSITLNLPKADRSKNGVLAIRKTAAGNTVTIDPYSSELVDSLSTKTLTSDGETVIIKCDGTEWTSISGNAVATLNPQGGIEVTNIKGDLIADDGTSQRAISVGTDTQVLTADSSADCGISWTTLDHDTLTNFVANEHIDHSSVTLTAGVGLTGGGDITSNRTFDLDINSLTVDATPDGTADYLVTYDASATGHKKVLLDNLPYTASNVGTGEDIFKQKNAGTLEFRGIEAGSSKVTTAVNADNIDIDVVEGNIVIGNLSGAPSGTVVGTTDTQILSNKTLTLPQINDTSADHQYILGVSELTADRTVTLPLLTGADTFVFENHTQTLTNKTLNTASNTFVLDTADVTTGTFADARVAASNVTQHEASITIGNLTGAPSGAVVGTSDSQTLTNKTINTASNTLVIDTGDVTTGTFADARVAASNVTQHEASITIGNLTGAPSGAVVGTSDTQTLTNKTLTLPQINDTSSDHQYIVGVSELTADRTVTLPLLTGADTFVFEAHTQTLTNKTLTTPVISTISNTGTLTLPTSTDTLVGRVTTDTFTNKTWGDNLNMNSNKIINLTTPTGANDAANKTYVDAVASGLTLKESCKLASTVDLDSNSSISGSITYNSTAGASSRGQITATLAVSDTFTMDSVNLGSADDGARILLKDQTTGAQNGIWTTTVSGTSLTLDRATDFDEDAEVVAGSEMFIELGTTLGGCSFVLITPDPVTIGGASGTSLTFSKYGNIGEINTVSNIGTGGVGIFKQKAGVNLEFKKINSTSATSGITVVDDTGNNEVDVRLDINSLTADATPNGAADYVVTYDASATAHKKVLLNNLPSTYYNVTATTSTSTTSGTVVTINSMSVTPVSGTYLAKFDASCAHSSSSSNAEYGVYADGTLCAESKRYIGWSGGSHTNGFRTSMSSMCVVTVNGSEEITVKYHTGGSGTLSVYERVLFLHKIA